MKMKCGQIMNLVVAYFYIILTAMSRAASFKSSTDVRFFARIAYDGSSFHGYQAQKPGIPTVQSTLLSSLQQKLGPNTGIAHASRTDVGVHARGNCIHFDVPVEKLPLLSHPKKFEYSWNCILPESVRVFDLSEAPEGREEEVKLGKPFHATSSAIGKKYSYSFCTNSYVDPLQRKYCAHFRNVDTTLFASCIQQFVGTHDFAAFANNLPRTRLEYAAAGKVLSTQRTVQNAQLRELSPGYYQAEFHIQSALYQMIRNMVGTSVHVASGKMEMGQLQELLRSAPGREVNLAKSAPPEGLVLEHVYYDNI